MDWFLKNPCLIVYGSNLKSSLEGDIVAAKVSGNQLACLVLSGLLGGSKVSVSRLAVSHIFWAHEGCFPLP